MSNNDFDKGWVKVEGFLNRDTADLLYAHVLLAKRRLEVITDNIDNMDQYTKEVYYQYTKEVHREDKRSSTIIDNELGLWGTLEDGQANGNYSRYGDLIFDTLVLGKRKELSKITQMNLVPQYSYYRLYTEGSELKKHKDRESCEISVTLCLGYDSHYNWPIWFENSDGKQISVELKPGDMVVYKGCDLEHWREPFKGNHHAQVFLHYSDFNGPYGSEKFDGRSALGLGFKEKK